MRLTRVASIFLIAAIALSIACDTDPSYAGIGLTIDGNIRVLYAPCGKDIKIYRLALALSGMRDNPIWQINSPDGLPIYEFIIGETPPGFVESVSLRGPIPNNQRLLVLIDSTRFEGETYVFRVDELRFDLFFDANEDYFTVEEVLSGKICN